MDSIDVTYLSDDELDDIAGGAALANTVCGGGGK